MSEHSALKKVFEPDSGGLLRIVVFDVSPEDWRQLLSYLKTHWRAEYLEDGTKERLPDLAVISDRRLKKTLEVSIEISGVRLACHFFTLSEFEMDLLPDDVDTTEKATDVLDFMRSIAVLLEKKVYLVPEMGELPAEDLRNLALCTADPTGEGDVKVKVKQTYQ
jgi:hypothetical protein